ncbi:cysteine--tRNA ligase [Helicobacter cappadocius]|uniref:Cysteine--tRNA ligase n=1 Tax=Helicobacter cappadocius TaxID=3063998 RepID=A0AA90PJZ3_9HELI|nr:MULTISPECIES: cysteine--tRNA ligase [unclassified Helicobacter]MDO7253395.1 cysteine--tRNA ligase [Helicobacter sp. faydin-H75]MDP2539341.1 cysteine--tRNA ligase [Helicobacter sp. faydin-H76]
MKIYDSRQKQKLDFIPIIEGKVRMYVCGPTVYDDAHLGHARSSIVFDLLARVLRANNYEVKFVRNFTDIDDKIIRKAIQIGKSVEEISSEYIHSYLADMDALLVKRPDVEPKATESLNEIVKMISVLLDKQIAYRTSNGDVYLSVDKDNLYGSISHRGGKDDENISRVEENVAKEGQRDFALWKAYKGKDDVGYETSLGFGRPGWHIECSAMIEYTLAYENMSHKIDIHGGGADLAFPHHENEASQTRCASGIEIAKYWMHNGFVNINGEKMSKSLGNSFFIKDALKIYDGEILRNYLLGVHYRAILNFNEEDLVVSKKRLDKIYRLKKRSIGVDGAVDKEFQTQLLEAMSDDLNISKALSVLEEMVSACNEAIDKNPKDKTIKSKAIGNIEFISELLGIGGGDPVRYFQLGVSEEQKIQIAKKLKERDMAKKEKNFSLADSIREELAKDGIILMDTPTGSVWEKVN